MEVGCIAVRPGDPSLSKGGLPTDKGWRKGSRTDSRLLAQAANKTVDAQVDAGRSRVGGGGCLHYLDPSFWAKSACGEEVVDPSLIFEVKTKRYLLRAVPT